LCETDTDGRLTAANDAFRALALSGAPLTLGVAPWSHALPARRAELERDWLAARTTNAPFVANFRVAGPDGAEVVVAFSARAMVDASGRVTGYVGTAHDATALVTNDRLNDQLVGALDAASDAIVVYDARAALVFANRGAADLLGVTDADADREAATTFFDAVRNQVPRDVLAGTGKSSWSGELGHRSPDGIMRTLAVTLHVVRGTDMSVDHFSVIARDVTEHKQTQAELQRQATHDELTGLPNRTLFLRRVAEALDRSRTLRRGVTVMFLDFDGLKNVNDTIGHRFGDQLIVSVGKRLVNATRPSDVVARLSGDEFAVLAEGVNDESLALEIAERLRASVTGQHVVSGVEVTSGASVGVAIATPALLAEQSPADAALTLLVNADTAMYRAKQRGKGRCEVYSEAMRTQARDRAALAGRRERALALDKLFLEYQPVMSTQTGRVVAAEALLRWRHPERGVLTPPTFLAIAEESGLIGPIGDWVVRTACADLRRWRDEGRVDATTGLHVNVSGRQLADVAFVERVRAALDAAGLDARLLGLEVPESVSLDDSPVLARTLAALARLGVRIGIDDFGTGYSSLAYLKQFPLDSLKIDRQFIRNLTTSDKDAAIATSIIQLAHNLGLEVVAEGVETEAQAAHLKRLGCEHGQGFLWSRPVAPLEAVAWMAARRTR